VDRQLRNLLLWTLAALVFAVAFGLLATWIAIRSFGQ
jgi:hypothetical protein